MRSLTGVPQHYAWGSPTAIPSLLGAQPNGEPVAEYWLGAHEVAPASCDGQPLDALLAADPKVLGPASAKAFGPRLPYLMKLLAAIHPLSLQAHPSRELAEAGFAREEEAGIAKDAFERVYRDSWPKPEIVIAIDEFHGLCGFRDPAETAALFAGLGVEELVGATIRPLTSRKGAAALAQVFLDVLCLGDEGPKVVAGVVTAAHRHTEDPGPLGEFARTAVELDEHFPNDLGILAALLLNRFVLRPGEALYLPPGNMHAYLRGFAVEVMANSDNVLRGGLTAKHVDVDELLRVVDFDAAPVTPITAAEVAPGVWRYPTDAPEFAVWRIDLGDPVPLPGVGARIVVVVEGAACLAEAAERLSLERGRSAFLAAGECPTISGEGIAYVAAAGVEE